MMLMDGGIMYNIYNLFLLNKKIKKRQMVKRALIKGIMLTRAKVQKGIDLATPYNLNDSSGNKLELYSRQQLEEILSGKVAS
jgi:hypothetical protein